MTETTHTTNRRELLASAAACMIALPVSGYTNENGAPTPVGEPAGDTTEFSNNLRSEVGETMRLHYLEIVTKDVDASCELYSALHGVTFADADPILGGARTSKMQDGGMIGIRAPMHDAEKSVTRAYILVKNIEKAVTAVQASGAEIAVPPMKLGDHGTCAIFIREGIEAGLWQL